MVDCFARQPRGRPTVYDAQSLIFRSATNWPEATSLFIVGAGLLFLLQGFRFARFLLPIGCMGGGLVLGGIVAELADLPPAAAMVVAAILGVLALARYVVGVKLGSAFTFGALAQYLAVQLGFGPNPVLVITIVGMLIGLSLFWVCRRSLPILITMLQGSGLLIVGFVGLTSAAVPSLGLTFQDWAERIPLMIPVLIVMLCTLGYSVQANALQGDMEVGGSSGLSGPDAA